jgi:PAS domain S-box-containing protein
LKGVSVPSGGAIVNEDLIANDAPVLIWVAGKTAECSYLNRQWLEFTGRTLQQELGKGWFEGVHSEDSPRFLETFRSATRDRRSFTVEFRLRRADGQYRWVVSTGVPRFISNDEVTGYIGTCFDIHERKLEELDRQKLTIRLFELQDEQAKQIVFELHNKVSQCLALIKNRATIALKDKTSSESVIEQLKEISATATAAISDVREISRNLRPYELDRLGLVAALESLIQHVSQTASISLSLHLDRIEGMLSSEVETSIYRIVQEAVHNITKHSDATSARIEIRKNASQLTVSIQDNGMRVPAQLAATDGDKTGGLGLAGIRERVRGFGGSFEIDSGSDRGTKLIIRLETDRIATE